MQDNNWKKSSTCETNACAEVDMSWKKSSACESGACAEVNGEDGRVVRIRNSQDPDGVVLSFSKDEWSKFTKGIKLGDFKDLEDVA